MAAKREKLCGISLCFSLIICFISDKILANAEKKIRMVNLVYRHGDRSPTKSFATDPNAEYWPQGLGQLTQIGMQQEYKLGQFLKDRYMTNNELLNSTYIRNEVYFQSTDVDRTIMSAQAQINGLYPPHGMQVWRKGLDWQPIPVHVVSKQNDILIWDESLCPRYDYLYRRSLNDLEYINMDAKHKDLLTRLGPLTGTNSTLTIGQAEIIHDILFCQQSHNLTLPKWANETVMKQLKEISDFDMYWLYHSDELAMLKGGSLLGEMIKHMKSYKDGEKGIQKAYVYSAHDVTVTFLLSVLKLFDKVIPPYSSAVMLELYSEEKGKNPSVQIFYRFGQSHSPRPLTLKGCTADCPLDKFIELTKDSIPENRDTACGLKDSQNETCVRNIVYKGFLTAFAITLTILLVSAVCLCCCYCKRRRSRSHAARVDFEDGMLKDASLLNNQDYDSDGT